MYESVILRMKDEVRELDDPLTGTWQLGQWECRFGSCNQHSAVFGHPVHIKLVISASAKQHIQLTPEVYCSE